MDDISNFIARKKLIVFWRTFLSLYEVLFLFLRNIRNKGRIITPTRHTHFNNSRYYFFLLLFILNYRLDKMLTLPIRLFHQQSYFTNILYNIIHFIAPSNIINFLNQKFSFNIQVSWKLHLCYSLTCALPQK